MSFMKRIWIIVAALALATWGFYSWINARLDPPVETVVSSSLKSLQEQNRLSAFAARFVTVVTSAKSQYGLRAEKTLIMPAMVRYEVDLAKLKQSDVRWDATAKMLTVTLPPLELAGPEFDLAGIREYGSGAVLMALTDVEKLLDDTNREKAKGDVLAQARAEPTMRLARDAHVRAIERSFAMPLKAAKIEANVKVEIR
jgi:hypothetical protein